MEQLFYHTVLSLTVMACLVSSDMSGPAGKQYFIREPSDVIGHAGETLTLICRVGNRRGPCQWTRDGLGLGVDLDLPAYPRFSMSSDTCDLSMYPVLPHDEGVYKCQVLAVPGSAPLTSGPAQVTMIAEPGQPHIAQATLGDVMEVEVGKTVTLQCESLGGKPAAAIQWSYADGTVLSDSVSQDIAVMEDKATYRTVSHLTIQPNEDLTVICTATSIAVPTKKTTQLNVQVMHMPRVHLSLSTTRVMEGTTVEITCSSEVYPALESYKWFINRQEIRGEHERTLRLEEISRAYDKVEITCRGSNKVGHDEATLGLTVEFAPKVFTHPHDIFAVEGDSVTFHCAGVGNPPPAYVWIDRNSKEVLSFSQNLKIVASTDTELEYMCRVFSEGFQHVDSRPASLTLIRRPDILTVNYKEVGGETLVHCSVKSASEDTKISWLRDGETIEIDDVDYEIIYNKDVLFHHSYLVMKSKGTEGTKYSCLASNEVGSDRLDAPLVSSEWDPIYILAPVILSVIVVCALVSSAVCIFKRIQKASVEKMEAEKKLQFLAVESQPCLSTCNNTNLGFVKGGLTPNVSWHSFNTISSLMDHSEHIQHSTPIKSSIR